MTCQKCRMPVCAEYRPGGPRCQADGMTEQIDTSSAAGRLVPHVFGALAEFERFTQQQ
jgi:hypothetical protein